MAKKDDRKKQKKRLKEQKRAATHAKYVAEKAKAERWPEIVYETSEGNGYFVAEVRAVAEALDFDSPEMGPDWMREFYRRYRAEGLAAARFWLEDLEVLTAVENGGAGTVSRRSKMAAHNRAAFLAARQSGSAPNFSKLFWAAAWLSWPKR